MSAREQMQKLAEDSNVSTKFVMDMLDLIIETVKEECCSGSQRWEAVVNFTEKKEPELIQGYTADQWQEIIDGGYLCEFRCDCYAHIKIAKLSKNISNDVFVDISGTYWYSCRPAQLKGVMRPIFVEPVDDEVYCHFYETNNHHMFECKWSAQDDYQELGAATSYMETQP